MALELTPDYGWKTSEAAYSCPYVAPYVLRLLKQLQVRKVLDLGAGNGALSSLIASAGYEVCGVDSDANGVRIAKQAHPEIPFYHYGVQDDPAALVAQAGTFDVVVATEVIEHLFSPHLLPRYAAPCLNENGHLVMTTPYHGYLKNLALSLLGKWDHHHTALWHGGHIKFWSRATLSRLLSENGFRVTNFGGVGRLPYFWKSMVLVATKM